MDIIYVYIDRIDYTSSSYSEYSLNSELDDKRCDKGKAFSNAAWLFSSTAAAGAPN